MNHKNTETEEKSVISQLEGFRTEAAKVLGEEFGLSKKHQLVIESYPALPDTGIEIMCPDFDKVLAFSLSHPSTGWGVFCNTEMTPFGLRLRVRYLNESLRHTMEEHALSWKESIGQLIMGVK